MKTSRELMSICSMLLLTTLISCKKDEPVPAPVDTTGAVKMKFAHVWQNETVPFYLGSEYIHSTTSDTLTFNTLMYYVSNIKLKNENGEWWVHPESYFLINASSAASCEIEILDVPNGKYTDIAYTMGVDSTRNVSGAQTGALSTAHGMFWGWNTGYIMIKAEGTSPNSSVNSFTYHLAGFSGDYNIVKENTTSFGGDTLIVASDKVVEINMNVDVSDMFNTIGSVSGTNSIAETGLPAKKMAFDFNNGVVFSSIVN